MWVQAWDALKELNESHEKELNDKDQIIRSYRKLIQKVQEKKKGIFKDLKLREDLIAILAMKGLSDYEKGGLKTMLGITS